MPDQKLKLKLNKATPNGKFWGVGAGIKKGKFPCAHAGCKFIATSVQSLGGHQGVHRRAAAKRLVRKGKSPARKNQIPKLLGRFKKSAAQAAQAALRPVTLTPNFNPGEDRLYGKAGSFALDRKRFDTIQALKSAGANTMEASRLNPPKPPVPAGVQAARAATRDDLAALLREHEYKAGLLRSVLGML